jgi:hypothetical protein
MSAMFHSPLITGTGTLQVSTYIPPSYLVGDYNEDGVVDAADYAVWRKSVGQASIPNRDPMNMGAVGQGDFNSWRAHFGETASGAGSQTAVPEPASLALVALAIAFFKLTCPTCATARGGRKGHSCQAALLASHGCQFLNGEQCRT